MTIVQSFYAAHLMGDFDSVESALRRAGLPDDLIAQYVANAAINRSEAVIAPVDEETSALVTQHDGRFLLWRGFTGSTYIADSEHDAREVIRVFEERGIAGTWAVFSYLPPINRTSH